MREHVHLPLNESFDISLAMFLKSVKQETSRQRRGNRNRFWLPRSFDFNVKTPDKFYEKLQYIHRNPVIRGLVTNPPTTPGAATTTTPPATEAPSKLNSTVPHVSAPQRPLTPRWTEHLWVLGGHGCGFDAVNGVGPMELEAGGRGAKMRMRRGLPVKAGCGSR